MRYENAGGQSIGNFSGLVPLYGSLGEAGTLSGSLLFAEPYGQWIEGGAYQAGIGAGFRHLFGKQSVAALYEQPKGVVGFLEEGIYVGANAFLNGANTGVGDSFWQLAMTAEVGTRWLELRGRYHLPLDDGQRSAQRFVNSYSRSLNFGGGIRGKETLTVDTTLSLLTESLRGWQVDATLLVPGIDRWADLRVIGGYASFESPTVGSLQYDSWRVGVDFRPVPAVVLSAMWHENEQLFGDQWLFGVGVEVPFETRNLGDGKGGFWRQVKRAFEPRRRHLAERLIEPARRHSLPMQLGTSVERVKTEAYYAVSLILPDGQVVSVVERVAGSGGASGTGRTSVTTGAPIGSSGAVIYTLGGDGGGNGTGSSKVGAGTLSFSGSSTYAGSSTVSAGTLLVDQAILGGTGATSPNGAAANLPSTGILNLLGGSSVTNAAGSGTQTGTLTLSISSVSSGATGLLTSPTLVIGAATLDRLIKVPGEVSAFYTGGGGREPLQAILLGPNGQHVFGLESYVTSEAGKAAIAALIAQGYTVPAVP
jgi:autotransporter-associated beta strand protein